MSGDFFAVGVAQWASACDLGLKPAVALLVLARGTGRDNITTTWSAEAVFNHSGMTWRRAKEAIEALEGAGIVSVEKEGARPIRKIARPDDVEQLLWLPNELVTGAGREIPPVKRLREADDLDALRLLIDLYGVHDLAGDGGLPRNLVVGKFKREKICERGQFDVYGFKRDVPSAFKAGPLARYWATSAKEKNIVWARIELLCEMGLLERVDYLAESDTPDSELIHPLSGDSAACAVADAAANLAAALPGGFSYEAEKFDYTMPVLRHLAKAAVVTVYRLKYRPRTKRTSAWFALYQESCKVFAEVYDQVAAGNFDVAGQLQTSRDLNGIQGA